MGPFTNSSKPPKTKLLWFRYNAINGVASCGNSHIQNEVLRGQFGFDGYIVSDCGGVGDLSNSRYPAEQQCIANVADKVHNDNRSSCFLPPLQKKGQSVAGIAMNAGCDVDCGGMFTAGLGASLKSGEVNATRLRQALARTFESRMRLGEFDDPTSLPWAALGYTAINSEAHQTLALEAAQQAVVLLRNENETLPLAKNLKLAVLGPNSNCSTIETRATHNSGLKICNMLGSYTTGSPFVVTPADGIAEHASVSWAVGSNISGTDKRPIPEAVGLAAVADATVLVLGLEVSRDFKDNTDFSEGESNDRLSMSLPSIQLALFEAVAAKAKKLVVVVMAGGPVDLSPLKTDKRIGALIVLGYPGMQGGRALADALFGSFAPSGRLPFSIYSQQTLSTINVMDMRMRPSAQEGYPGRTHRFSTAPAVFEFGFGLQNWGRGLRFRWVSQTVADDCSTETVGARRVVLNDYIRSFGSAKLAAYGARRGPPLASRSIVVTNDAPTAATSAMISTSVLVFVSAPGAGTDGRAIRELLDFKKLWLAPGQSKTVEFAIHARDATLVNGAAERVAVKGAWTVRAGGLEAAVCL